MITIGAVGSLVTQASLGLDRGVGTHAWCGTVQQRHRSSSVVEVWPEVTVADLLASCAARRPKLYIKPCIIVPSLPWLLCKPFWLSQFWVQYDPEVREKEFHDECLKSGISPLYTTCVIRFDSICVDFYSWGRPEQFPAEDRCALRFSVWRPCWPLVRLSNRNSIGLRPGGVYFAGESDRYVPVTVICYRCSLVVFQRLLSFLSGPDGSI